MYRYPSIDRPDDRWQNIERGRSIIELSPAVVGDNYAVGAEIDCLVGIEGMKYSFEEYRQPGVRFQVRDDAECETRIFAAG